MKVGIMGGTFNPIHQAHLMLAQAALKQYALDVIWFMPSHLPAHKSNTDLASSEHRWNMVKLAVEGQPQFAASDFELKREGFTYTYETLTQLCLAYPEHEFFFLIGGDSLAKFSTWVHPEIIAQKAVLLAAGRSGYAVRELEQVKKQLEAAYAARIDWVLMPEVSASSHEIRRLFREGQTAEAAAMLPEKVAAYIQRHGLYRNQESRSRKK